MSTFQHVTSRLGNVRPQTRSTAEEVYNAAKKAGHDIWFMWGMGTSAEHKTGRALDWMVRTKEAGDFVRNYLWANRKRLRLRHVIWRQHITSTVTQPGTVRKMEDRGNPTANHFDHVHSWQFDGAYQPPGKAPAAQKLAVDGKLGPKTIRRWQQVMKTQVDGKISEKSSLVRKVQERLKATVDHRLVVDGDGNSLDTGVRRKTIEALQRYLGTPVDGIISEPKSQVIMALQRRLNENRF